MSGDLLMNACIDGSMLAIVGPIVVALVGAISALFGIIVKVMNERVKREQDLNADLTALLNPSIAIADSALSNVRRQRTRAGS